ncbi:MAG: hypothetical protein U9Q81_17880 [Pseudomonadota bacterium]|nr:hypothetical protein [Pseudomonadota bacterium]
MTSSQAQAIWELCREGFPLVAYEAETHWQRRDVYAPDRHTNVSRALEHLIERCNWETEERSTRTFLYSNT